MPGLLDTFKQKATEVKDYLYPSAPNGMNWMEYAQFKANDPLQPNLSSRITQQDFVNKGLLTVGIAPLGMTSKVKQALSYDDIVKNSKWPVSELEPLPKVRTGGLKKQYETGYMFDDGKTGWQRGMAPKGKAVNDAISMYNNGNIKELIVRDVSDGSVIVHLKRQ